NGTSPQLSFLRNTPGGFVPDSDITVNTVTAASDASSAASASISITSTAQPGPRTVAFTVGNLTSSTVPRPENTFNVAPNANTPTITGIAPAEGSTGSTVTGFTLSGANLTGATLQFFKLQASGAPVEDTKITQANVSNTAIQFKVDLTIPDNDEAGPRVILITTANGATGS